MELNRTIAFVLSSFGLNPDLTVVRINSGHINYTFKVGDSYILQRINKNVFLNPLTITKNLLSASTFLKQTAPDYKFLHGLKTPDGIDDLVYDADGYPWRLFPYIKNTITINEVETINQAYEAAKAFGLLSKNLAACDINSFEETIPQFHNLSFRYSQFEQALLEASNDRKERARHLIDGYIQYNYLVHQYENLVQSKSLQLRVMHNDTKINNVLFEEDTNKAICVIDLDTLMPGYFIYDLGDMVRTFVSPSAEDEIDISKIEVRKEIQQAILDGYLSEMDAVLTNEEKLAIPLAGPMMTYMIGIRFLTDFLRGDVYYQVTYRDQNLNRATNQFYLLEKLKTHS